MDRMEKLHRFYARLTIVERTKLALAAQAEGDLRELDLLDRTCPIADLPDYITRLLALQASATLLVAQLLACEALLAHWLAGNSHPPPDLPAGASHPALGALIHREAAIWYGFVAWCYDLGHDPLQALLLAPLGDHEGDPAHFILHQQIERFETWAGDLLPDPHHVQVWRDLFAQALSDNHSSTER